MFAKEVLPVDPPVACLKLFGRTVTVPDSQQPSSPKTDDRESSPERIVNVEEEPPARPGGLREFSMELSKSAWTPWPCVLSPLFYCMQLPQEASAASGNASPPPWWTLYGGFTYHQSNLLGDWKSAVHSSTGGFYDVRKVNKEGSWTGSNNSGSVSDSSSEDMNSEAGHSGTEDQIYQHNQSSLKANNSARGFVPYQRFVNDRVTQNSQLDDEEKEELRIRLSL